eukprot:2397179-Rhodomonas_salina.1
MLGYFRDSAGLRPFLAAVLLFMEAVLPFMEAVLPFMEAVRPFAGAASADGTMAEGAQRTWWRSGRGARSCPATLAPSSLSQAWSRPGGPLNRVFFASPLLHRWWRVVVVL